MSEDLTRRRSNLFYRARQERKGGRFKHCWSADGRIRVRHHNDTVSTVTTPDQLSVLIENTPLPESN